jgi:hypothetical protein
MTSPLGITNNITLIIACKLKITIIVIVIIAFLIRLILYIYGRIKPIASTRCAGLQMAGQWDDGFTPSRGIRC